MPDEPLRTLIEGIHTRLHDELDVQLHAMAESHARDVEAARQAAHDEAERKWTAQLEAARLEWSARMQAEVSSVRSEAERALIAETMRARVQAEQAAAESTSIARRELEESYGAERRRLEGQLEAERQRTTDVSAERDRLTEALDAARRRSEGVEAERQQLLGAVEAERAKARTEIEAERGKMRTEFDAERARLRSELDVERDRLRADLEAERRRLAADVDTHQRRIVELEAGHQQQAEEIAAGRHRAEALKAEVDRIAGDLELARLPREQADEPTPFAVSAPPAVAAAADPAVMVRLSESLSALDAAADLSTLLGASVRAASREAPRAALFVVEGAELREFPVDGIPSLDAGHLRVDGREAGVMAEAVRRRQAVASSGGDGPSAPFFATLPTAARSLAVPLTLGGTPVAVLYADDGTTGEPGGSWTEAVEIVGRHATACAASITALRTAQAMRYLSDGQPPPRHNDGGEPATSGHPLPGFLSGHGTS